jgi:hypothetical protein
MKLIIVIAKIFDIIVVVIVIIVIINLISIFLIKIYWISIMHWLKNLYQTSIVISIIYLILKNYSLFFIL